MPPSVLSTIVDKISTIPYNDCATHYRFGDPAAERGVDPAGSGVHVVCLQLLLFTVHNNITI